MAAGQVLSLNAGSSSLKFAAYHQSGSGWQLRARGCVDGIDTQPRFTARDAAGAQRVERMLEAARGDPQAAVAAILAWLRSAFPDAGVAGIGHRVVHGGPRHTAPARVTPALLDELRALADLAPLHQPGSLAGIEASGRCMPGVPQVACFDTSFHRGWQPVAELVPLPADIRGEVLQRYGFHGLSYEHVAAVLARTAPRIAAGRVIVAHLGNGASLCALEAGRSVDCTFGFSPLDGLCMGTRPGALDPGILLYLLRNLRLSVGEVETLLYEKSGLLGVSGVSGDMRELLASAEPAARLAVDFFVYRAAREIGGLAAVLGGIDGLVFTGGIGENSPEIRRRICASSAWLGIELDADANAGGAERISPETSRVPVRVVPADEELVIARHTARLLGLGAAAD